MWYGELAGYVEQRSLASVNRAAREKQSAVDRRWLQENLATAHQYRLHKRRRMRPEVKSWGRKDTGVLMQIASGHALIRTYQMRIGKEETDECRWCESGERESRGHLFSRCERFTRDRRTLYSRLRADCKLRGRINWPVWKMLQEEKATGAVMAFLKDTTIGYNLPSGTLWPGRRKNCPVRLLCFVFSFVFPLLFSFSAKFSHCGTGQRLDGRPH